MSARLEVIAPNVGGIERLDRSYRKSLMTFFFRRVKNMAEAEDLTQEVFLRLLKRSTGGSVDNLDGYVFKVATNTLRDAYRRDRVRFQDQARRADDDSDAHICDFIEPYRILQGRESLERVIAALHELNERTREIFILYRLEDMKQHEIAKLYGVSTSTVEKEVAKAMALLARRIGRI